MDIAHFIRSRLKIRHMHILLALDETLSVSRAASKLNLAQASVSRTLAEIEEGFAMPIFERHPRGLRRTRQGAELVLAMRQIVGNLAALEELADQFVTLGRGEVRIGLHNTASVPQLTAPVVRFKEAHPNVTILFREGLLPALLEDLRYGRLDMVFGRLPGTLDEAAFGTVTLARANMVIVARDSMPPPPEDPKALLSQPWAIPPEGASMRIEFDRYCARHGQPLPADRIEAGHPGLLGDLLSRQDRYALYPVAITGESEPVLGLHFLPWMRTYPFPEPVPIDRSGIVYSTTNARSPAAKALLEALEARALQAG